MDRTVHNIIAALKDELSVQLSGLGDFPKSEPFEHGVQVGTYRGIQKALERIETVLNDIAEEDSRR